MQHIFGCGLLARHTSPTLTNLSVTLEIEGDEEDEGEVLMPTAMQSKDAMTVDTYPSIMALSISRYVPQNIYMEFMYLKRKFTNLEDLEITRGQYGLLNCIPTQKEFDDIIAYLFIVKTFNIGIACRMTMGIVSRLFIVYRQINKMIFLTIHARNNRNFQGSRNDSDYGTLFNLVNTGDDHLVPKQG